MANCVALNATYGFSIRTNVRPNGAVAVLKGAESMRLFDYSVKEFAPALNLCAALAFVDGLGKGMHLANAVTSADLEKMSKDMSGPDTKEDACPS